MAGGKKKKSKPVANSARGFATTSVASKPVQRVDVSEESQPAAKPATPTIPDAKANSIHPSITPAEAIGSAHGKQKEALSAEEFEKHLEESDLQLQVEKHASKTKRDAQRQKTRMETDRRLLRAIAEPLNVRKWLPPDLLNPILDIIEAESRFSTASVSSERNGSGKPLSEEEQVVKLWTLQQTLIAVEFPEEKIKPAMSHILDISHSIATSTKDSIWGLEEALDWMAQNCENDTLPDYESKAKAISRLGDTPQDSPLPSGTTTPRTTDLAGTKTPQQKPDLAKMRGTGTPVKVTVTFDSDVEPDDLVPAYLETQAKLFTIQRGKSGDKTAAGHNLQVEGGGDTSDTSPIGLDEAKLLAKIDRIKQDILFDKDVAEQQWRAERIILERELAALKKKEAKVSEEQTRIHKGSESDDEVTKQAQKMPADILQEVAHDDDTLAGLFENLPIQEIDPSTGISTNVLNDSAGTKIFIRDFAKWTGVSPMRVLEEACRSRDSGARLSYASVSEAPFAKRQKVLISWSKAQILISTDDIPHIEGFIYPTQFSFEMTTVATPDTRQSEAYIATVALFATFESTKEEKAFMRLPATWKDIWAELVETRKNMGDARDRATIKELRCLVRDRHDRDEEEGVLLKGAFRGRSSRAQNTSGEEVIPDKIASNMPTFECYQNVWAQKSSTPRYLSMLNSRKQLPMWQAKGTVLTAIEQAQVVIVCGETGCGKSTQVPSFILEHQMSQGRPCKIFCTEPRRISAISLARRVSEEMGEGRNDLGTNRSLVGYNIRLESKVSKESKLVFATTGIVMRMLENTNDLRDLTHIIIDEVHERSIESDFLLIVLKKLLLKREDLRVVLMSATVDAEKFSKYMGGAPVLTVPGRTFPVHVQYLEDAVEFTGYKLESRNPNDRVGGLDDDPAENDINPDSAADATRQLRNYSSETRHTLAQLDEYQVEFELIIKLISRIAVDSSTMNYSQAILVFLPGINEIRTLNDLLLGEPFFQRDWEIFPLHSAIAGEDQERAFLIPPPGVRKIVLATNIAETGITIPDVTCVIDTGKHREMRFDEKKQMSRLIDAFISKANAKQRRGRAGRVQEGLCFHMFTKYRHDNIMSSQQTPEILRLSLQDLAIQVKICKLGGIEETLSEALDPPSAKNIRRAIDALIDVRALTLSEELTPLGHQLARLPLDVFLGKLILQGTIFKCLDMAITVAAILTSKSPFSAPFGQRAQADKVQKAFSRGNSDPLTIYNAYLSWKNVCQTAVGHEFQYCKKNFLSSQTFSNIEDLKGQFVVALLDSGFLQLTDEERHAVNRLRYSNRRRHQFFELPQRVNINSQNDLVTASVIGWSFYPKLLLRENKGFRNISNNQTISLPRTSVNKGNFELKWLSYYNLMQSKRFLNAQETTAMESFAIALLCGDVRFDMYSGVITLDGNRARFHLPNWKTMLVIKTFRARIRDILTRCFKIPGRLLTPQQEKWLDVWQRVFERDLKASA